MEADQTPGADRPSAGDGDGDDVAAKGFFSREIVLYAVAFLAGVAIMLLIPRLLNNMILVFVVMMLVIYVIPERFKRRRR